MLVVLDALGVIFRTRDDRSGHLSRFVAGKGSDRAVAERDAFVEKYFSCTRGECATTDLWSWCGLDPAGLDEEYVAFYVTTPGLYEFITDMRAAGHQVACLTNDAAAWSRSLRETYELDRIDPWVISSEVGIRKPEVGIFDALRTQAARPLEGGVFVDDTETNLDAAAALGMHTIHFRGNSETHQTAHGWPAVAGAISTAYRDVRAR